MHRICETRTLGPIINTSDIMHTQIQGLFSIKQILHIKLLLFTYYNKIQYQLPQSRMSK